MLHCSKRTQCTTPQLMTYCARRAQLNTGLFRRHIFSVPSSPLLRPQAIPASLMKTKHTVLSSPLPLLCTFSPSLRHSALLLDRRSFKSTLSFPFRFVIFRLVVFVVCFGERGDYCCRRCQQDRSGYPP